MKKLGKKAIAGIFKLIAFILAAILLFFLIKNKWDVKQAFGNMLDLFG